MALFYYDYDFVTKNTRILNVYICLISIGIFQYILVMSQVVDTCLVKKCWRHMYLMLLILICSCHVTIFKIENSIDLG